MQDNSFSYCKNQAVNSLDQSGKLLRRLLDYLEKENKGYLIDNYSYGILIGNDVAVRAKPYTSGTRFNIDINYVDDLYVEHGYIIEGDNIPSDTQNPDPDRVWLKVIVFPKKEYAQYGGALEGYISAEYIYLPFGNENYSMTTTKKVNLRYTPDKNKYRKAVLDEDTDVTPLFNNESGEWYYCSTPKGAGWINRDYLTRY